MTDIAEVVLDAGAFIQIEHRDQTMVALAELFIRNRVPMVTSAAVVAQVWRTGEPRQAPIARLLRNVEVVPMTHQVARVLGRMLATSRTSDPIDAHVVFLARERGCAVLTSDPDDLVAIDPDVEIRRI